MTIDEYREEIQKAAEVSMEAATKMISDNQENILIAFVAKYGLPPEEIVSCFQNGKFWVEKKTEEHIAIRKDHHMIQQFLERYKKMLAFVTEIANNHDFKNTDIDTNLKRLVDWEHKACDLLIEIGVENNEV